MAQHVLPLLDIVSLSKYEVLANSCGKPVVPSSSIYNELSKDMEQKIRRKISPKYLYVILQKNRYNVWNKFLKLHNFENVSSSSLLIDTSDESLLNNSGDSKKINLQLILSFQTWLAMSPEEVEYADKKLTERSYNVLLRKDCGLMFYSNSYGNKFVYRVLCRSNGVKCLNLGSI